MSWYVRTESKESKEHDASVMYHGPMSLFAARVFKLGIEYVDDLTMLSSIVNKSDVPAGSNTRELFHGGRLVR